MGKGQSLYKKAKKLIPGGTQLLSKRPEMFLPDNWPSYYSKAKGVEVWDLDGNEYIDMSYMGIGACVLGYADPDVDSAVKSAVDNGSMCTLNCPEEVELAELLCRIHPWAQMVRYARGGGEAVAIAVRIARAATGREKVVFCGYHGWHDWYLSVNLGAADALDGLLLPGLQPAGVPHSLKNTALTFYYNDLDGLKAAAGKYKDEVAAIVIEPVRRVEPQPAFLEGVRKIADDIKAVLICDEVSSGWRLNSGGAHLLYGLMPDIAVFAKGMSNGYPMAAVIGRERVMQAAQQSFISSTYWTERTGPAAALATIKKHIKLNAAEHLIEMGKLIQQGWQSAAGKVGLKVAVSGIPPMSHLSFEYENSQAVKTLFTQEMLQRGFLATNAFYAAYAHKDKHIKSYLKAAGESFAVLKSAIDDNRVEKLLGGPVAHSGFYRLT